MFPRVSPPELEQLEAVGHCYDLCVLLAYQSLRSLGHVIFFLEQLPALGIIEIQRDLGTP
jgi:hypothetical protein